ncbi:MAG: exodeoxyribonuclease VII small subunit [Bacilli bacterium]|nr:exodeoxyribonuclease VII small subunit [Bacilli bacterium]
MEEKGKTFEQKIKELELIVSQLESGNVDLDDAINKYTSAMQIAKECSEKLKNAEEQINKVLTENGTLEDFKLSE